MLALLVSLLVPAVASAYDRDAAVKHAEAHWNDKSDSQPGGYIEGSDCTNYASGCFFAGGLKKSTSKDPAVGWWCRRKFDGRVHFWAYSVDWVNADEFRQRFWGKKGCSRVGTYSRNPDYRFDSPTGQTKMVKGDVVSVNEDYDKDSLTNHTEFCVGNGTSIDQHCGLPTYEGDLINQHTSNRHKAIWHMRDRRSWNGLQTYVFQLWHLSNDLQN